MGCPFVKVQGSSESHLKTSKRPKHFPFSFLLEPVQPQEMLSFTVKPNHKHQSQHMLSILLFFHFIVAPGSPKVSPAQYSDALCPFYAKYIQEPFTDACADLTDMVNVTLCLHGKAQEMCKSLIDEHIFDCQHIEIRCQGNMVETCSIKLVEFHKDSWAPLLKFYNGSNGNSSGFQMGLWIKEERKNGIQGTPSIVLTEQYDALPMFIIFLSICVDIFIYAFPFFKY